MNTVELINERADLHESVLSAEFRHVHHPTAFTRDLWTLAVRNWELFDIRIQLELKRLRRLNRR